MKKKMLAAVMCMVLCFSAVSCGKKDDEGKDTGATPDASPTAEATPTTEADPTAGTDPTTEVTPTAEATTEEETKYSNKDYGFEITVPKDFMIYDEDASMNIIYQSMALMYQSVDDMMAAFEALGIKYPFVAVTTKPAGANMSANIITQLCPVSALPGSLEDVVKQSLSSAELQYKALGVTPTTEEPEILQVDGKDICVADSNVHLDGDINGVTYDNFTVYQKFICFDSGSSRIMISCTYYNEDEEKEMEAMVDTIRILK